MPDRARRGRLVAFDLDGTLIDSRRDLADSANQLVTERGGGQLSLDAVTAMVGEGAALLVRRALDAAGLPDDASALTRFLEIYDQRLLEHTRLYPGVVDAVRAAREGARVVVLTNKPLHHTTRVLDGLGIRALFDEVVGGDGPLGRKPDPSALLELMATAGARGATTLMVGDSPVDLDVATRAGARACLVSFGFGFAKVDPARHGEALVVHDGRQLAALVRGFAEAPGA